MKIKFLVALIVFFGQKAFSQSQQMEKSAVDELCGNVANVIKVQHYSEVKGKDISNDLLVELKRGAFYHLPSDSVTKHITKFLRNKTHDIHFYVGPRSKFESISQATDPAKPKENLNGGFVEVKILKHNIGYIKWVRGMADDEAFEKIKSAFVFLKGVDFLVFDITENPGGDGRSNGFINQHLYATSDYQQLLLKKCRGEADWVVGEVPYNYTDAPKFFDVPVYIITSKNTGSSAEYFAFIAQQMKRATILGETTAGAGNPVVTALFGNFGMMVPHCEIKTKDGKSIEGKGVLPDVQLKSNNWIEETVAYIIQNNKK